MRKNLRLELRQKLTLRQIAVISSASLLMLFFGFFVYLNFSNSEETYGAVAGDYRSIASGNWSSTGTWQRFDGSNWVSTTSTPTNSNGEISIRSGHTVTITANVTADQIDVESNGTLVLNSGKTLTLANGSSTDLSVTGTFRNAGSVTINSGATIAFQNNGKYQHNHTTSAGTIPTATWNSGSTCEIIGYTDNDAVPAGLNQTFHHFTWDCDLQNKDFDMEGNPRNVNGNFTIAATGSKKLYHSEDVAYTLNVGANFCISGGKFYMTKKNNLISTVNIGSDYIQTGGTFTVVEGNNAVTTFNISNNWSHTAGTLTTLGNSSSTAEFIFKKSGTQVFTSGSNTVSGRVNYTVNSGSTLDLGTAVVKGNTFTTLSGSTLIIGSPAGITSSGSTGNVQTGFREFNSGGNYIYDGSSAQTAGSGLPSSVASLTINNSSNVTLSNTVSISNSLTFTSGKLICTGSDEVRITNASTSAITGHNTSRYIVGPLRRNVNSNGAYVFPIGTNSYPETATVTLNNATGFSYLTAEFKNSNPISALLPLVNVVVNGLNIDKLLNYGYWSVEPNSPMTGGTYSISLSEKGHAAPNSGGNYCILKRNNILSGWQSIGTHVNSTQTMANGIVSAVRSGLTSFSDFAIGYGEFLTFKDASLISGVNGQPGAIYLFEDVCTEVDAWIQIISLENGATLSDIDYFSAGYDEAWQPYVKAEGNRTSSIKWKITFKIANTATDTVLPYVAISAVDVDGDSQNLREFVEATNIYSYALNNPTDLIVTNNNGAYRATSTVANVADIDTSKKRAIFQINYQNVTSFNYETGAITTSSADQVRQNCMYFKYFFAGNNALPIKLASFTAKANGSQVDLKWSTISEENNDFFTIERSSDGMVFEPVLKKKGAGTSSDLISYSAVDPKPLKGTSYYRLKQTDFDGTSTYSEMETVTLRSTTVKEKTLTLKTVYPTTFRENFTFRFDSPEDGTGQFILTSLNGQVIKDETVRIERGSNDYVFADEKGMIPGVYLAILMFNNEKISAKVIKEP